MMSPLKPTRTFLGKTWVCAILAAIPFGILEGMRSEPGWREAVRKLDGSVDLWVAYAVTRDQMMAKHQANHIQVVYASDAESADNSLYVRAAMAQALGIKVNLCGTRAEGGAW